MPHIELAMAGKIKCLRAVNGVPDEDESAKPAREQGPDGLVAFLRARAS